MQERPAADNRLQALKNWMQTLSEAKEYDLESLAPASSDASFRRYFRVQGKAGTAILMDAPPPQEDIGPFLKVDRLMLEAGLNVPRILASDSSQGFILMTDLGRETYLDVLNETNAPELFDAATDALVRWQLASKEGVLPAYDRAVLRREVDLFPTWYIAKHCAHALTERETARLEGVFNVVLANNLAQPRVFVHRDFMPRNLMVSNPNPGVLDFQDALMGPITYDIASLMRDAFLSWPEPMQLDITIRYWEKARKAGLPVNPDFGSFWHDVDAMALQRHLKVLGIFARINYRDGKPKYLADTPRFVQYVRTIADRYEAYTPLLKLMDVLEEDLAKKGAR